MLESERANWAQDDVMVYRSNAPRDPVALIRSHRWPRHADGSIGCIDVVGPHEQIASTVRFYSEQQHEVLRLKLAVEAVENTNKHATAIFDGSCIVVARHAEFPSDIAVDAIVHRIERINKGIGPASDTETRTQFLNAVAAYARLQLHHREILQNAVTKFKRKWKGRRKEVGFWDVYNEVKKVCGDTDIPTCNEREDVATLRPIFEQAFAQAIGAVIAATAYGILRDPLTPLPDFAAPRPDRAHTEGLADLASIHSDFRLSQTYPFVPELLFDLQTGEAAEVEAKPLITPDDVAIHALAITLRVVNAQPQRPSIHFLFAAALGMLQPEPRERDATWTDYEAMAVALNKKDNFFQTALVIALARQRFELAEIAETLAAAKGQQIDQRQLRLILRKNKVPR